MSVQVLPVEETEEKIGHGLKGPRIRCPKCDWSPSKDDLWGCECGHFWHTFDTGGVCPGCIKQWESTQCPKCHGWSAHSDWYQYE
jgi:hypothetical protein